MIRARAWVYLFVTMAATPSAMADDGKCSFGGTKIADDCAAVGWQAEGDFFDGCCVQTSVVWCETDGTALCTVDCPAEAGAGTTCGWYASGSYYWCGETQEADPSGAMPLFCPLTCTGECTGKACGFDGCAGSCGTCGEGSYCTEDGQCEACSCEGNECGLNQCGESCGTCGDDSFCSENTCKACSCDGKTCGSNECGDPCGTCTGGLGCLDGQCVEQSAACVEKEAPGCSGCAEEACVCDDYPECCTDSWDFFCVYLYEGCAETQCACVPDCDGKTCGSDGCGGTCGTCADGEACAGDSFSSSISKCLPCSCGGATCGKDACGNDCGTCSEGSVCVGGTCQTGQCAPNPNGEAGCEGCACETCVCDDDPYCCNTEWDDLCAAACGSCGGDCGACLPDCELKECGDDNCGGSCGSCGDGQTCNGSGLCCTKQCDGKQCGGDGCGGSCGECESGLVCKSDQCVVCTPQCDGKTCGDNGCGGTCGECEGNQFCSLDGVCVAQYPASCLGMGEPSADSCAVVQTEEGCCDDTGRVVFCYQDQLYCLECGEDGQKGLCGWSPDDAYYVCGAEGPDPSGAFPIACGECTPNCEGKQCGSNGCGGTCGTCEGALTCNAEGRCEAGGTDGTDGSDGTGGTDGTSDTDGTGADAGDGTDSTDGTGGADSTDTTDGTGSTDGTNGTDGSDDLGGTGGTGTQAKDDSSSGCQTSDRSDTRSLMIAAFAILGLVLVRRRARLG